MEKYKANRTGSVEENVEQEQLQKSQEEINTENNVNTIKNAAKVAKATKNPYAMAAGYAVEGLDKLTGGKSTEMLGKAMTKANKSTPGGNIVQGASNALSESGVGDTVGQAADLTGGGGATKGANSAKGANTSKGIGTSDSSNKTSTSSTSSNFSFNSGSGFLTKNIMPSIGGGKFILFGAGGFFFIIIIIFMVFVGQKDSQNMAITNLTVFSESTAGGLACTNEQIEEMLTYVGGNNISIMSSNLGDNVSFFYNVNGYSDFKNNTLNNIESSLNDKQKGVVVLSFDIYDLGNFDNYVITYKDLINKYPRLNFYVLSFGQVDDSLASLYGITNSLVNEYNDKIKLNFGDIYLDINSFIGSSFISSDGVTYDSDTYNRIHQYVLSTVSSNDQLICSGGSIENMTDEQLKGASFSLLSNGETVLSKMTTDELNAWNSALKNDRNKAGVGTGLAPAIVAFGLIQGSMSRGFIIPYFYGGGHSSISVGVNGDWGSLEAISLDGNRKQPVGQVFPSGLDDTGLIAWVIKNGGCSNFSYKTSNELAALGEIIDPFESVPGDLVVSDEHSMMVIRNDGLNLLVAEANVDYGVVFNKYNYNLLIDFKVISMTDYYDGNCHG